METNLLLEATCLRWALLSILRLSVLLLSVALLLLPIPLLLPVTLLLVLVVAAYRVKSSSKRCVSDITSKDCIQRSRTAIALLWLRVSTLRLSILRLLLAVATLLVVGALAVALALRRVTALVVTVA